MLFRSGLIARAALAGVAAGVLSSGCSSVEQPAATSEAASPTSIASKDELLRAARTGLTLDDDNVALPTGWPALPRVPGAILEDASTAHAGERSDWVLFVVPGGTAEGVATEWARLLTAAGITASATGSGDRVELTLGTVPPMVAKLTTRANAVLAIFERN